MHYHAWSMAIKECPWSATIVKQAVVLRQWLIAINGLMVCQENTPYTINTIITSLNSGFISWVILGPWIDTIRARFLLYHLCASPKIRSHLTRLHFSVFSCAHCIFSFLLLAGRSRTWYGLLPQGLMCCVLWDVFLLTSVAQRSFQGATIAFLPMWTSLAIDLWPLIKMCLTSELLLIGHFLHYSE